MMAAVYIYDVEGEERKCVEIDLKYISSIAEGRVLGEITQISIQFVNFSRGSVLHGVDGKPRPCGSNSWAHATSALWGHPSGSSTTVQLDTLRTVGSVARWLRNRWDVSRSRQTRYGNKKEK